MFIPIEMKIGCFCFGLCPVKKSKIGPIQNLILGQVEKIHDPLFIPGERYITIRADSPDPITVIIPEYRISEFDFGGIPVRNPWFDPQRIQKEDELFLQTK